MPTREQIEQPAPPSQQNEPRVSVESKRAFADENCPLTGSDIRVSLTKIQFESPGGGDVPTELRPFLAGLQADEGGDRPISVVCAIRDRLDGALARAGYVARVQLPAQELQSGVLRVIIVAGRITEFRVRGDVKGYGKILNERLERIKKLSPFNRDEAIRLLLAANEIPGLQMRLDLRNAGTEPGELIADVTVEVRTGQLLFNARNYGSTQLGREVGTLSGEIYGLTGMGDRTYVTISNSLQWKEIHVAQIGHYVTLDSIGSTLGARLSVAQSEPDIENLDLRSRSLVFGVDFSRPLFRNVNSKVDLELGFEILNQATRFLGSTGELPYTRDRQRVLIAAIDASTRKVDQVGEPTLYANAHLELRQGVDIFSATKVGENSDGFQPSRIEGDARATVLHGRIDAGVRLLPGFTLNGSLFGQYSNKPLLNLEEFTIGNFSYGRGYDPGANGGDRAIAGRIEPRVRVAKMGPVEFEATGFYDIIWAWNLDSGAGSEAYRRFESVGGGLRAVLPGRFELEVTYARPLTKVLALDATRPPDRILVSLTTKLLPWGRR